jgi:hypothetical protein
MLNRLIEWSRLAGSVLRETCRYLEVVGGVFKPKHVGALDDIRHGIELNSDAEVD